METHVNRELQEVCWLVFDLWPVFFWSLLQTTVLQWATADTARHWLWIRDHKQWMNFVLLSTIGPLLGSHLFREKIWHHGQQRTSKCQIPVNYTCSFSLWSFVNKSYQSLRYQTRFVSTLDTRCDICKSDSGILASTLVCRRGCIIIFRSAE